MAACREYKSKRKESHRIQKSCSFYIEQKKNIIQIHIEIETYVNNILKKFGFKPEKIDRNITEFSKNLAIVIISILISNTELPDALVATKRFDEYELENMHFFYLDHYIHRLFVKKINESYDKCKHITYNALYAIVMKQKPYLNGEICSAISQFKHARGSLFCSAFCLEEIMNCGAGTEAFIYHYNINAQKQTCIIYVKSYTELYKQMFTQYCSNLQNLNRRAVITKDCDLLVKLQYLLNEDEQILNICKFRKRLKTHRQTKLIILDLPGIHIDHVRTMLVDGNVLTDFQQQQKYFRVLYEFDTIYNSIIENIFAPQECKKSISEMNYYKWINKLKKTKMDE